MDVVNYYSNYDPKDIYLFEIIGSYFVDIVYNHIYINTKIKLSANTSFIDEYIRKLQLYLIGIKNDKKCYNDIVKNLYKYYITISSENISYFQFITNITNTCILNNLKNKITIEHKEGIVSVIICDLVSNIITYILLPENINQVINQRSSNSKLLIRNLQDYSIQVLLTKKLDIQNKFIKETGQVDDNNIEDSKLINNFKKIIKSLIDEKKELLENIKNLENENNVLLIKEEKLKRLIKLLQEKEKVHYIIKNLSNQNFDKESIDENNKIDTNNSNNNFALQKESSIEVDDIEDNTKKDNIEENTTEVDGTEDNTKKDNIINYDISDSDSDELKIALSNISDN